ncbi:unnamed protein product [Phaedon cochleariae]|uniref:MADF domain-containing protein n=1 Tax=Phaedon cochleariae TaxID=80249 RepID=A0A9N9SGQ9_PHACE|nr:unnamed protein product [Phaedon cochleariae]
MERYLIQIPSKATTASSETPASECLDAALDPTLEHSQEAPCPSIQIDDETERTNKNKDEPKKLKQTFQQNFIYIPVVLVMPTKIQQTVEQMFSSDDCGILEKLQESMDKTTQLLEEKLPILTPIDRPPSLKDLMASEGKVTIEGKKSTNLSRPDVKIRRLNNKRLTHGHHRSKRIAPLVIWGGTALLTLAGVAIYNRADIEIEKSHMNNLLKNQETLEQYAKTTRETVNLLIDREESLVMAVNNIKEKINEIIKDYTCLKKDFSTYMDYMVTWSNIAPNSFLRAVNGALGGKLTIDLLPGDQLQRVMQYYPEFADTIFQKDPLMMYQSARVKVLKISKNPPMLETIVSVPRVLYPVFGSVYAQKACPWKINNTIITIKEQTTKILSAETHSWYSMKGCNGMDNTYLCDMREMIHTPEHCLSLDEKPDLTKCPLVEVDSDFDKVVQTPDGDICKKKWKTLRDAFQKAAKSMQTKSGQAATISRKWKYWDAMSFLLPHIKGRETQTNVCSDETGENFEDGDEIDSESHFEQTEETEEQTFENNYHENPTSPSVSLPTTQQSCSSSAVNVSRPVSRVASAKSDAVPNKKNKSAPRTAESMPEILKEYIQEKKRSRLEKQTLATATQSTDSKDSPLLEFFTSMAKTTSTIPPLWQAKISTASLTAAATKCRLGENSLDKNCFVQYRAAPHRAARHRSSENRPLLTLAGVAINNRADIEIEKSHINNLLKNQETLEQYAKTTRETVNLLIDREESLVMAVNNITEKIIEIIEDYTCLKKDFSTYMDYMVTWSNIAPNSFLRAVNGALGGKLTIDLLPGDQLQRVMQY